MKALLKIFLITTMSLVAFGCRQKKTTDTEWEGIHGKIDLFPKTSAETKLTIPEAFEQSKLVIKTNAIKYIDQTLPDRTQEQKIVFLYKIENGQIEKSATKKKITFPVYFVKHNKTDALNAGKDSIQLYLKPIENNSILGKYMKMNWELIENIEE